MEATTPTKVNKQITSDASISILKGVGARLAEILAKLGIYKLQDLWFHLPMRYLDRTRITPIGHLRLNTNVGIEGRIQSTDVVFGKRRSLVCVIEDNSGRISCRFFHFSQAQKARLQVGVLLRCFGEPRMGKTGLELYHPEYEFVEPGVHAQPLEESLTPIYPLTEGLTQARLRKLCQQAVNLLQSLQPQELLPTSINQRFGVKSLADALAYVHSPPASADVNALLVGRHPTQQRLAFEELLAHHLAMQQRRALTQAERAPALNVNQDLEQRFIAALNFQLTQAQTRVIQDIKKDLAKPLPMLRMVQGDVGSGKTLVAMVAALTAIAEGYQVAIVAPTEILAEQHKRNFTQWLKPLGFEVAWLVSKLRVAERRESLTAIASGLCQVVIGTHALFQEQVSFKQLGLVVVDEQHRFGVHQRLALRQKGEAAGYMPHQLVMTATPIPRTLAMTAYGDLDYSVIDELPPGRQPVTTALINQQRRQQVIDRVREACLEDRQAYWVCTLVEDSETLAASAAEQTAAELRESLPELNIGLVHGRLKSSEKDTVMAQFKAGELQLLVATTVIEVGVDVPNASLMVIENPERLGLAQLHQLRGRVGRGSVSSHCVLLYGHPLSQQAKARLGVLRQSNDGFFIAERDLELRGPGELLGTRQTGDMQFRLADLERDAALVEEVRTVALSVVNQCPQNADVLIRRWIGEKQNYAKV